MLIKRLCFFTYIFHDKYNVMIKFRKRKKYNAIKLEKKKKYFDLGKKKKRIIDNSYLKTEARSPLVLWSAFNFLVD